MRAKLVIDSVVLTSSVEVVHFAAVSKPGARPGDGVDPDNTYATFSPIANVELHVTNPAQWGIYKPGQQFEVEFIPTPAAQG